MGGLVVGVEQFAHCTAGLGGVVPLAGRACSSRSSEAAARSPGPESAGLQLPGAGAVRGPHVLAPARPRTGLLRCALPLPRSGRGRRGGASATCTRPLRRPVRPLRRRPLRADRAVAAATASTARSAPPERLHRAYEVRATRVTASRARPSRSSSSTGSGSRGADRPFPSPTARVAHPVEAYAVRVTENSAGRRQPGLLRRHRAHPARWSSSPAGPTCCCRRRRS